jgi:excinuclease UvrABC helicase subunit UvrB
MLRRSEDNAKAALLLLGKRNYNGSVVAFYYSVLQRMMYALNETDRRPLKYESQNPLNEELHHKILTEITNRIDSRRDEDGFKVQFEYLFELRKKADYEAENITQDECAKSRTLYEGLMEKLNRLFPIKAV